LKKNFDAIVIGAGSVGCPTTYFLAKEGFSVLCIDELPSSGQGSNKAAIGGVRATHSDPAKIALCKESLRTFSQWEERTGTNIGWKMGGYCFPVYREEEEKILKSTLPVQKEHDLNIDWVDPDFIKEKIPGINPEGLIGGTFSPEDGQVSPLLASESFTDEARALGAEFLFKKRVTDLMIENKKIKGIRSKNHEFFSEIVVNTAGNNGSAICKMAGLEVPIIPDLHEGGISSPVKPFLSPLVVDLRPGPEGKTANFYFGQVESGQIIFCYTPAPKIPGVDAGCTSEFMPIIARRLVDLIPRFKNLLIRRLWRGTYPMTPDGIAVVGDVTSVMGFYLGVGMCGQGFMMGPGVGANLAQLISKGRPKMEKGIFHTLSCERDYCVEKEELLR
jgi:sarcosine oxidase subunit beta